MMRWTETRSGADDGRVSDFENLAYWPGKPYPARTLVSCLLDPTLRLRIRAVEVLLDDLFEDRLIRIGLCEKCH
jgi:hypothetical protein